MRYLESILSAVGNTPLVKLNKVVDERKMARVLVKAEYLMPSGSLKDRMAVRIIEEAERQGRLSPGGTIVEATAGNTGMALAMVAAVKGYQTIFVMPDKFSIEKINMLKAFGSKVVITPTSVPDDHPESWREVAKRIVKETPNSMLVDQFANLDNVAAHYQTTGPEIWEATEGAINAFVAGAGSGGMISGAGRYLKEQSAKKGLDMKVVLMDPVGSIYYDTFYGREPKEKRGWKLEGIGNDFIPGCLDLKVIDEVRRVSDRQTFFMTRRLAREEGLLVGDTSGAGVYVALELARELGPGKTVVAILCDSGNRYISKVYNDQWLRDNGFSISGLTLVHGTVADVLKVKGEEVYFAEAEETVAQVAARMAELGISQMPVHGKNGGTHLMVHESDLLQCLLSSSAGPDTEIAQVASPLKGLVSPDDDIAMLDPLFREDNVAVVTDASNQIIGIVSQIDVVKYLSGSL